MATKTQSVLRQLQKYESRNILFTEPDGSWPIVWERAQGCHVWDAEGRRYLDLTAAFGVTAAGHANRRVVRAGQQQMSKLLHAMGDVHPHPLKAALAQRLSEITFGRWHKRKASTGKTIFCNSGSEAVEAALKTAKLATGKPGVIAFDNAYHGLGYGALNATHRQHFKQHFKKQLGGFATFIACPTISSGDGSVPKKDRATLAETMLMVKADLIGLIKRKPIGALLIEPIQARGGIHIFPPGFLRMLRTICDEHGVLLIFDEIYTGFGRTGHWFACEREKAYPDLICLGKALTGGFPLSACVGSAAVMDRAWPPSSGEAIHTSTFLGHPVGCAMALAQIAEIERLKLVSRTEKQGALLLDLLKPLEKAHANLKIHARCVGMMAGLEVSHLDGKPATGISLNVMKKMLREGYILLPEGEFAEVISLTPPLTITETELRRTVKVLGQCLAEAVKEAAV